MFEWDVKKAAANERKHGVRFSDTEGVFEDDLAITDPDPDHDEERFVTLGLDGFGTLLVVAYAYRGDCIRIISARRATRAETRKYEEQE